MVWIAITLILFAIICLFVFNGFRTRCPACGKYSLHPKDPEGEAEQQRMYDIAEWSRFKPSYANRRLKCNSCGHLFDRHTAIIWLRTSNKLGEERALNEYRRITMDSEEDANKAGRDHS